MSAFPGLEIESPALTSPRTSSWQLPVLGGVAAILGLSTLWPTLQTLWFIWTTDALKSIGIFFPVISFVLIFRVWRALGWQAEGTWWGLLVILANAALVWVQHRSILLLVISPRWTTVLPPMSLPLVIYGAGAVLLLGGRRLLRAALFPVLLLWFANPVPRAFSVLVDLPLQTLSAHIARGFAMHLGQPLTPDHLRLMFTPEFGMFIAPGCNGIRGAVTMGFIALIAGYIGRLRWTVTALLVTGAILLGYLFNLLRLCLLVLYYLVALHLPWLRSRAENADYIIGAALFLTASFLLFSVIHRLRDTASRSRPATLLPSITMPASGSRARIAALAATCIIGFVAFSSSAASPTIARNATQRFPPHVGSYNLVRTWNESASTGPVIYQWAEYAPPAGPPVAIGISPVLGWHDPLICHNIRGDQPLWQGPLTTPAGGLPVSFSSAMYSNGVTRSLEASTQCSGSSCNEFATARSHLGFVYTRLDSLLSQSGKPIPVLVRAESLDTSAPLEASRRQLTQSLQSFLASVDLQDLTRQ